MIQEYLPILKREENGIRVIGKRERELCHGKNPVFHGTAVIAAVLPDGRLLLADKTEKQQKKEGRKDGSLWKKAFVSTIFSAAICSTNTSQSRNGPALYHWLPIRRVRCGNCQKNCFVKRRTVIFPGFGRTRKG